MKYFPYILFLSILGIFFIFSYNHRSKFESLKTVKTETRSVYLGAWVGGFWDDASKTLNTSSLSEFEKVIDKKVAVTNVFTSWDNLADYAFKEKLIQISDNGWVPMISSNPVFFDKCLDNKLSIYKTIASGECDSYIREAAVNLRSYEKPLLLRFAWEMNLPDMYWSIEKTSSTPEDFVNAWKRLYSIFKEEKAENVEWVLSFNTSHAKTVPYAQLFPGDEFVDWVAIDGYNWGNSHDWSGWASFSGVFTNSYYELTTLTNKPVMLSEVNSAPQGGNKAEWLKDMLEVQVPNKFPNIEMIVFFNENKTGGESVDWRIEKSDDYVQAVKTGLQNSIYKSNYP